MGGSWLSCKKGLRDRFAEGLAWRGDCQVLVVREARLAKELWGRGFGKGSGALGQER